MKLAHQYAQIVLKDVEGLTYSDKLGHALRLVHAEGEEVVAELIRRWAPVRSKAALKRAAKKARRRKRKPVVERTERPQTETLAQTYAAQCKRRPKTRIRYGARTYGTGIYAGQDRWK
jgi:hypothetical protein